MVARALLALTCSLVLATAATAAAQDEEPASDTEVSDGEGQAPLDVETDSLDDRARELFLEGRQAYVEGRFETALRAFRASYELSGRAELLFNVGTTLDRLRRSEDALEAFERYLEEAEGAENRAEVEARIRSLQHELDQDRQIQRDQDVLGAELRAEREARLRAEAEDETVFEKWWFWTIIGSVIIAGVVVAVLVFPIENQLAPDIGSTGLVTTTLSWP